MFTYDINTWSRGTWGSGFTRWSIASGVTLEINTDVTNRDQYLSIAINTYKLYQLPVSQGGLGGPVFLLHLIFLVRPEI
jgi:hypothetical protein